VRKTAVLLLGVALALSACGGGGGAADCSEVVDEGLEFYQDLIDDLDGKSPTDLEGNPLETGDYAERANDLERRTVAAGCSDAEIAQLMGPRIGELEAGPSNPTGQAFIAALSAAIERGGFDLGG